MHNLPTTWRWATKAAPPPAEGEEGAAPPKSKYAGNTPEARRERARHAALVRYGKENPMQARIAKIRAARKAKAKKGKGGGKGKAKAAPKPTVDKAAEEAANRAKAIAALGLMEDAAGALEDLAKNGLTADDGGLEKMGLAEQTSDGQYRLTAEGKRVLAAANKGDAAAARVAMSEGKDRLKGDADAAATAQGKADEKAKAKAEKEKAAAEKPKKGGGGGGGKAPKEKPADTAKDAEKAKAKALVRDSTAREVGLRPNEASALRAAADGGQVDEADVDGLAEDGLVEPDGKGGFITTDAGRRALGALERGDKAGYRAALQDIATQRTRKGLSMKDQRRLVRAGRATFGKDGRFALSATKAEDDTHTPPLAVQAAARRALERRAAAPPSARGMTPVGLARARDLSNGRPVSVATARRMVNYFTRHQKDKQGETWGEYGPGRQAWDGWGGDAGWRWARGVVARADAADDKPATKAWRWAEPDESAIKHGRHNQASHGRRGGGGGRKGGGKRKARTFANRKQRNADGGLNKRERDRLQAELRYRTDPDRPQSSYDKQRAAEIRATLAGKALMTWRWAAKETPQ